MTLLMTTKRMLIAGVLTLCATATAFAQDVSWTNPGPLGAGQRATLDLVFEGTRPSGAVRLPAIDGVSVVGSPSESSRISIVNGRRSDSVTLSYPVRAEREGRVEIPAFDVSTTDGQYTVPALSIDVGAAMLAGTGISTGVGCALADGFGSAPAPALLVAANDAASAVAVATCGATVCDAVSRAAIGAGGAAAAAAAVVLGVSLPRRALGSGARVP